MNLHARRFAWATTILALAAAAGAQTAPKVRLIAPGEEPRAKAAFALETDSVFEARVEFSAERDSSSRPRQSVEGMDEVADQKFVQTPVRLREAVRVLDAKPDAASRAVRKMLSAELRASPGELSPDDAALDTYLDKLPGREFFFDLAPDGAIRSRDSIEQSDVLGIGLRWLPLAEAALPVFPPDEIGVGARWSVEREIALEGITVPTAISYTLKSISEEGFLELEFAMTGSAPPQPFDLGADAAGAECTATAFELRAEGTCVVDRARPVPVRFRVGARVEAKLALLLPIPEPTDEIDHLDFDVAVDMRARYSLDSEKVPRSPQDADAPNAEPAVPSDGATDAPAPEAAAAESPKPGT